MSQIHKLKMEVAKSLIVSCTIVCFVCFSTVSCISYSYSINNNSICGKKYITKFVIKDSNGDFFYLKAKEKGLKCFNLIDLGGSFYEGGENFSYQPNMTYEIKPYPQGDRRKSILFQTDSLGNISREFK